MEIITSALVTIGKFISGVFLTFFLFYAPVKPLLLLVGGFIILDTIAGVWAAYRLGQPILSRKLARLAIKLLLYTAIVLLVYPLNIYVIHGGDIVIRLTAGALAFIEAFSIDEKIRKVNDNKGAIYYIKLISKTLKTVKGEFDDKILK